MCLLYHLGIFVKQFKSCLDVSALVKTATQLDSGMSELNLKEQRVHLGVCVCVVVGLLFGVGVCMCEVFAFIFDMSY